MKGECYKTAAQFALDNPEWIYTEGVVINRIDGLPMGHAWVENGDKCRDTEAEVTVSKDLYYSIGKIEITKQFERSELIEHLKGGVYGSFFANKHVDR